MTAVARGGLSAPSARYSSVAILLHWLIAAGIVLQVVLAGRMEGPHTPITFAFTQLHKSVGITILLLSLVRLGWRLAHPPALLPVAMARWEVVLSKVVHVGFYVVMIAMPLTGWLMVSASRTHIPTLLYGAVPWPNLPLVGDLAPAAKALWAEIGKTSHHLLAKVLYVLFGLHVAGALKHQFFGEEEPVLSRMAPGAVSGRWAEPRVLAILLGFIGVIAFGRLVTPPGLSRTPPQVAAAANPAPVQAAVEPAEPTGPAMPPSPPSATIAAPAAVVAPPAKGPAAAPELVKWVVQPGSRLGFASAWSGQPIEGRFRTWRADIMFSPDALDRSKVTVSVDVASADTGDEQRDAVLPTEDWFDATAHPKAVFTARRFEKTGADRYVAHGTLQLRGVTKPQDLAFRLRITGDEAEVTGSANLDRTVFGVGQGDFAGTDEIPGKVGISFSLRARRG